MIEVSIDAREAIAMFGKLGVHSAAQFKRGMLKAIGMRHLKWINDNFEREGKLRDPGGWVPLRPNTVASRRKNSSAILQDTGRLRMSFVAGASGNVFRIDAVSVTVGSNMRYAAWHEKGTRPYTIVPRRRRALAFMTVGGKVVVKRVRHPGLPARPMLPRHDQAAELAQAVAEAYWRQLIVERSSGAG